MNVRSDRSSSYQRYRRRILGWGAAAVVGLFAIGGPIFVNRVEDDLEERTVEVLNAAGIGPVTAHFSGQDGELRCVEAGPVEIPDGIVSDIAGLRGVSSIEVDQSCSDSVSSEPSTDADLGDEDSDTSATNAPVDSTAGGPPTTEADGTSPPPDLDLLTDVIASDSQFSTLASLIGDADLAEQLSGEGPFSVFAPTNAAFEALGPDLTGALARDPEVLATVLSHHVTAGAALSTELVQGDLDMLDGSTVTIDVDDSVTITSGESVATVTEADLVASNGVVHAIDQVLLPTDIVIADAPVAALAGADLVDGQLVLRGVVASEEQRTLLLAAPGNTINLSNVLDELVVDSASPLLDESTDALALVIEAMASNLVSGSAESSDAGIAVSGTFATEAESEAFEMAVGAVEGAAVTTTLVVRPIADDGVAATVEADLNQLVLDNPILFDPSSTTISDESVATIDRVAAVAKRVGGITIVVEGHTDTDGLAESNLALSEGRARSVREALVARGVDQATLTILGLGGTEPILDADGVEDKPASRRVEFVVSPT